MKKNIIKKKITSLVNFVHNIAIGGDAGERTMRFVKNLSVSFVGGLSAFALLFAVSIIAARFLGPEEYGKYAIFFSIAQMIALLFVLELDISALYFLAQKGADKKRITASIITMFFINIIVFSVLSLSLYCFFDFEKVSLWVFVGAMVMAFSFALKRMVDAFLRADNRYKTQSILRLAEALIVLGSISALFYVVEYKSYYSYAFAVILGGLIFSVVGLWFLRSQISLGRRKKKEMEKIFHYNIYGIISAFINGVIKNADKLLVAAFLGVGMAGVYAAYFTVSVVIGERVMQIFINVFFPSVRGNVKNVTRMYKKVNAMFAKTAIPLALCASAGVAAFVLLYGAQYPFVWLWVLCGGVYIAVHFFASLYGFLLSSISQEGYKMYNVSFLYGAVAYGAVMFFAIMGDFFSITVFLCAFVVFRAVSGIAAFLSLRERV